MRGRASASTHWAGIQFLVASCVVGALSAVCTLPFAGPTQQLLLAGFIVLTLSLPLSLRCGVPPAVAHVGALSVVACFLVAMCLASPQLVWPQFYWFAMLPLAGGLLLRARGALLGGVFALLAVGAVLSTRTAELGPPLPVAQLTDVAVFLASMAGLSAAWVRVQSRAVERAEREARARQAFLAQMSHELRTPMNGVLGVLELLDTNEPLSKQQEQVALIRRSGQAMVSIIDELLDYARLESGRLETSAAPFQVRQVVADVVGLNGPRAQSKGLSLTAQVDDGVPSWLAGDALRVRQVTQNLVNNAVKFTSRGGVRVAVSWRDGELRVSVQDDGIGIDASGLTRLFLPFQQARADISSHYGGTGLGLAISRGLCRLMGGDLTVRSTPGVGSTFVASCRASACGPGELASTPAALAHRFSGRVLVVDDNDVNLLVASRLCERAGLTTVLARDGAEAVAFAKGEPFDLVLMDCQMPVLDGFEATAQLRALPPPHGAVPIVALTASAMPEEVRRCLAVGMNDVIAKPIDVERLERMLERFLSKR
ncbi:MAG: response regulator [Archangium sp.]|nr:response regulator [Archangium sp.]